jgi:hypothetical protein
MTLQHSHSDAVYLETCEACFWAERLRKPMLTTFTGRRVNPMDLKTADIDIRDIAHHLACINRWCGALREPISVAQHCVHVSWLLRGTGLELDGLLHDASEAYLGDVSKWIKRHPSMESYREAEDRATAVIAERFGIQAEMPDAVEQADRLMINIEGDFGFQDWKPMPGFPTPSADTLEICNLYDGWPWALAEARFLSYFKIYDAERRKA